MHVGIDGSRCVGENQTGVEKYSSLLIPPLIKILRKNGHDVTVYAKKESPLFKGAKVRVIKIPRMWTHLGLGLFSQFDDLDFLFVPSHVLPLIRPKKCLVVIHDVCFEQFPLVYPFIERWYLRLTTADAARNAKIITHSQSTKDKLEKIYKTRDVKVVPPGSLSVANDEVQLLWRKPYLLYIGRVEKKKNVKTLIKAFDKLLSQRPDLLHSLVILGGQGFGFEDIKETHSQLKHKDRIVFQGYVLDRIRDEALRKASGLVLPSLCEGTSLVLLEARTARVPFASSFCRACQEAGGQTGIYVTKNNVEAWTRALEQLIEKPLTPDPAPIRSWEDVALDVYQTITG